MKNKNIKIDVRLHNFLTRKTKRNDYQSLLYLLGKDKENIYVKAILLNFEGIDGCEFMPGANTASLTKAFLKLTKEKLTIDAFALVAPEEINDTEWGGDYGDAIYNFSKNVVFITFGKGFIKAEDSEDQKYEIDVVKSKYLTNLNNHK
jgi:hypothetical protein